MKNALGIIVMIIGFGLIVGNVLLKSKRVGFFPGMVISIIGFMILGTGLFLFRSKSKEIKKTADSESEIKKMMNEPSREFKNEDHDRFKPS